MRCNNCGTDNPEEALFCSICGSRLVDQRETVQSERANEMTGESDASQIEMTNASTTSMKEEKGTTILPGSAGSNNQKKPLKEQFTKKKLLIAGLAALVAIIGLVFSSGAVCLHSWEDATCTTPKTCSKCHKTKGKAIGHKWSDATCTEAAKCEVCGETKGDSLGHSVDMWSTTKEATCSESGTKEGKCTRCGKKLSEEIDKTGHDWGEWSTAKEATCTENRVKERTCKRCGEEEKDDSIKALGHDWGDWKTVKKATCTENGVKEKVCNRCKKSEKDNSVKALGHDWGKWKTTKKATYSKGGEKTRTCKRCGKKKTKKTAKKDISTVKANMTMEQKNAYKAAQNYLDFSAFSKRGLIDQLSSEYGDNYPVKVATFAVELLEQEGAVDWYDQAEKAAENYLDFSSFSKAELIHQLESDYGDKFTHEQAVEGVNRVYK